MSSRWELVPNAGTFYYRLSLESEEFQLTKHIGTLTKRGNSLD